MPPSVLWPFPLWTAAVAVVLLIVVPCVVASVRVRQRNRRLRQLAATMRDAGMSIDQNLFAIGEDKNVMLVSGNRLAIADLKSWQIAQILTWAQTRVLKIYHNNSNHIEFRLVINGGAQTRRVRTFSIAGFGRLFIQSTKEGKPVEYVQS